MIKILIYFLQSILIYSFFLIGLILGIKISRKLFSFLFFLIGPIFKSNKIVNNNLNIFSNTISSADKKNIINNMWKNYGKTFIEYIFLYQFRKKNSHIFLKGEENLIEINKKNKSVIFISGHFANFELMSMEITKRNIPLATIYRPLNNLFLNPFMEYIRKKFVCSNQIKKGINGVRQTIEYIKKNHCIALMIDQRVSEGEQVSFFNKRAFTTTLPAQLSTKFNLKIIPVYIERDNDDNFKIEFQKAIDPNNFKNKLELTQELNNVLERMIIRNPGQWIWTHNRWK
ncbi:lysophospholipid acyltransferase family protein [Candidatus Pelagibacter bacterium]|nr:lysophospholipid acyltransferase family protein [Candidatus Pelagibacter bacterium]MDA9619023.1 lysophospholipid acyltransferase family protein [Candidatus Pelagibacter bacterium]